MKNQKLKILFVGLIELWENRGDSQHFQDIAKAMKNVGCESNFLCLRSSKEKPVTSDFNEVHVPIIKKRFLRQLTWNFLGLIPALIAIYRYKIDIIYNRPAKGCILSFLMSKLTRKPLVVEINGLATEDLRLYQPHGPILLKISKFWERLIYSSALMIVAAPGYAKYISENFEIPLQKFCITPLGVNRKIYYKRSLENCRKKLGLKSSPTIVWIGNMSPWQGLQNLLDSMPIIKKAIPLVQFFIIGEGPEKSLCQKTVLDLGLEKSVYFTGHLPQIDVSVYIGAADICVAMFPGNRGKKGSISSLKTISYLSCARPVVTTDMDEMGEIIQGRGAGLAVPPDNPSALAQGIINLLKEESKKWSWRCKQAELLADSGGSWEVKAERIHEQLIEMSNKLT